MFTLQSAQDIIALLTRLLAYIIVITPAGAFRAWISKKMGDPTAYHMGFTSFNPIIHIDIIGVLCLILFGFGWGRQIPQNFNSISGKWRTLKIVMATFSGVFAYMIQAVIYFILLALLAGNVLYSLMDENVSSLTLVIGRIFIACIGLCIFLAAIESVINSVLLLANFLWQKRYYESEYVWYALLVAPLVILLLFGHPLQYLFKEAIIRIAGIITDFIGIITKK